tara:strand:- start:523 stop:687 length:165 start_codon:yes stop_codon:yes gene_type:complete
MSPKDIMVDLLHLVSKIMVIRCKQSIDKAEAKKWQKNIDSINFIIKQVNNGGIK